MSIQKMAETGCATCDGQPPPCAHCWHSVVGRTGASMLCCRCEARRFTNGTDAVAWLVEPEPVPDYRDTWATPPSEAFRRTDGEGT